MSTQGVEGIQRELQLTAADTKILKGVKLIWAKLESARKLALKDDRQETTYRELLRKSLQHARKSMAPENVEEISKDALELWSWVDDEMQLARVDDLESRRGMSFDPWCQKWLPEQWKTFDDAIERYVAYPSGQNINDVKAAFSKMLQAYVEAV